MNGRVCLYLALIFVVVGNISVLVAKRREAVVAGTIAKAVSDRSETSLSEAQRQLMLRGARGFHIAGFAAVLFSAMCWGFAAHRHERLSSSLRVVLIGMFALYLLLQCMVV